MNKKITKNDLRKFITEMDDNQNKMKYAVKSDDQSSLEKAKQASKTDGVDSTIEILPENDDYSKDIEVGADEYEEYEKLKKDNAEGKFDEIMEELKNSSAPKIKISENINPRIKKSDLINYFKNKK